jgi:hypothetical protein
VDPVSDLVQSVVEVLDGESFSEPLSSIHSLPVTVVLGIFGLGSLVRRCVG